MLSETSPSQKDKCCAISFVSGTKGSQLLGQKAEWWFPGAEVGRGGRGEKGARETVEEVGWRSWVGRPEQGDGGEEHPPWSRRGPLTPVPGRPVPHASQQDVGTLVPLLHLQPPPSAHPRSPQAPTLGSSSCPLGLSAALRRGLKPAGVWGGKKVRRQRG